MIRFNGVGKLYDRKEALDQVTFCLPEGKIIGVVGPNGSGKSTLLHRVGKYTFSCFPVS